MAVVSVNLLANQDTVVDAGSVANGDTLALGIASGSNLVVDGVSVKVSSMTGIGVQAATNTTFAAQNGGMLTVDQGVLNVSLLGNMRFEARGDGAVKLDASALKLGLTDNLLNAFSVGYTDTKKAGSFIYKPAGLSLLGVTPMVITVDGMGPKDSFTLEGRGNLALSPTNTLNASTAYRDGHLFLGSMGVPLFTDSFVIKIAMTQAQADIVIASIKSGATTYLNAGTFTFPGALPNGIVSGTSGDDLIDSSYTGDPENDEVDANDAIAAGASPNADTIHAGQGHDTVRAGADGDLVRGEDGNDLIYGEAGNDSLYGDAGNDRIFGGIGNDLAYGGLGADQLNGDDGNDSLYGDAGNDTLQGNAGDDVLYGGAGDDSLIGGDGQDSLYGGDDADKLYGGDGTDGMFGGAGNDLAYGGDQGDLIAGGDGNDSLYGDAGNDTLQGDGGQDLIYGGAGADLIFGGGSGGTFGAGGIDEIYGGSGNDTLSFGAGRISGDDGNDRYLWQRQGNATIEGFGTDDGLGDPAQYHDGDGNNNDVVDLSAIFNPATLATYNALNGTRFVYPLSALNHDLLNQQIDFNGSSMSGPSLTIRGVLGRLSPEQTMVPCFVTGSLIDTPQGARAIEDLRPGDLVQTKDHGPQPVRWIGHTALSALDLLLSPRLRPIRIRADAAGAGLPHQDLLVSPQHRILAKRGPREVLVAAKYLLAQQGIHADLPLGGISYLHLLFDRHEILRANGLWCESLLLRPAGIKALPAQMAQDLRGHLKRAQATFKSHRPARRILPKAQAYRGMLQLLGDPQNQRQDLPATLPSFSTADPAQTADRDWKPARSYATPPP